MDAVIGFLKSALLQGDSPSVGSTMISMVLVALAYWAVFALAAPLCLGLVPSLRTRPRKEQLGAFIRVPSLVNCLLVTALGSHLLFDPALVADRLHGRSPGGDLISLLAAGYFLFDVTHACFDYQGLAFLMHAVFCLCIFTAAIQPFCQYYAVVFLFFEVSTIFLNVMWYIKYVFDVSESHVLYRAVAALFAVSFFLARIAMGNIMSWFFWRDLIAFLATSPPLATRGSAYLYLVANVVLSSLNAYWFWRIVSVVLLGSNFSRDELGVEEETKKKR